jgi:hypothetical protein
MRKKKASKEASADKQPVYCKPSREEEAGQAAEEYADDQREIIKKLRNPH